MPELPSALRKRYLDLKLPVADVLILAEDVPVSCYFDAVLGSGASPKLAANWILGDLMAFTKVLTSFASSLLPVS